ncbi:hypothetical protein N1851_003583 [Merluccius polli]|uniref:HAT C-terminal dimerisation domain-containing protein n=1 Tax=Merluccius polli TaxID=89951 RepID=A0AA47N8G7_MERPO|nr:hypothetical protein N1851_003583 [Merluccius polli]
MLKSSSLDLARVMDLVGALTDTLQDYRSEGYFGEIWKEVEEFAEHCKISVQTVCKSLKQAQDFYVSLMSTVGQRNSDKSIGESFQIAIFYQVLDCLAVELKRHFSKKNCETSLSTQRTFESDLEDLKHDIKPSGSLIRERKVEWTYRLLIPMCHYFVVFLEPYNEVFYELFRLCRISVVTPVSSASCKRSFSALKRIKPTLGPGPDQ